MDIAKFKSSLKEGGLRGVYILGGEEEYLIRYYLGEIRRALDIDPTFAVFNNPSYEGGEVDFGELAEAVKSPPMMSDYKLVEWRHADFASMKEGDISSLSELCELVAEHPYSIVVFTAEGERADFGTPKRPSKFFSAFDKKANLLNFEKSTEAQLYGWLKRHFDAMGVLVDMEVVKNLVFRVGKSMDTLLSEAQKLAFLALSRGRDRILPEDISEVSISTPESDTFALSNAITDRNKSAAYTALLDLKNRRVDPTVVLGMVAKTFDDLLSVSMLLEDGVGAAEIESALKMNPYKVKIYLSAAKKYNAKALSDITAALTKADADSKYGGVTGYTAIELFLAKYL